MIAISPVPTVVVGGAAVETNENRSHAHSKVPRKRTPIRGTPLFGFRACSVGVEGNVFVVRSYSIVPPCIQTPFPGRNEKLESVERAPSSAVGRGEEIDGSFRSSLSFGVNSCSEIRRLKRGNENKLPAGKSHSNGGKRRQKVLNAFKTALVSSRP